MATLTEFLQSKKISEKTIQKLIEEEYDLETFRGLTVDLLRLMNFKMSEVQVLLPLIGESQTYLHSVEVKEPDNVDRTEQSTLEESTTPTPGLSQDKDTVTDNLNLSPISPHENDGENDDDDESSDGEECNPILEPYFSAKELAELGKYEKRNNVQQLLRYEAASNSEVCNKELIKPCFVKRKEQADKKKISVAAKATRLPVRFSSRYRVTCSESSESGSVAGTAQNSSEKSCLQIVNTSLSREALEASDALEDQGPDNLSADLSEIRERNQDSCGTSNVRNKPNTLLTSERSCLSVGSSETLPTSRNQTVTLQGSSVSQTSTARTFVQSGSATGTSTLSGNRQQVQPSTSCSGRDKSNSSVVVGVYSLPDNFECIKPDLIKYDVLQILNEKIGDADKSKDVLRRLISDGILRETKDRKLIIRVLTRHLYSLHPSDPSATTTKEKESMAKSFVRCFPKYCGPYDENTFPWDHVYCKAKNTGWIVNASRTLQSKNRQRSSKRLKLDESVAEEDTSDLDSEEEEKLRYLLPEQTEWREILGGMKQSYNKREKFRYEAGSIAAMNRKYNHLTSFKGEVLRQEFRLMRPKHEDMCKNFMNLQKKILELPAKTSIELVFEDDTIRALVLLSQHLPHDIPNRQDGEVSQTSAKEEDIIEYLPSNTDLKEYLLLKRTKANKHVQPYLIGVKSAVSKKLQKHFLVLDEELMECQGAGGVPGGTIRAIDYLLKSYFVYHVSYPYGWRNTLHFLASSFLKVFDKHVPGRRKDAVTPSERELMLLLSQ